jgi:hypothetical protein
MGPLTGRKIFVAGCGIFRGETTHQTNPEHAVGQRLLDLSISRMFK